MEQILRRETRVSGVKIEDDRVCDSSAEASSLVLKPTLESIWSLPQDPLKARDRNQGLGRVEAAAYNPETGEVLVAADRELVLWKVDFDTAKGHPRQRIKSVAISAGTLEHDGHHDGAVVRQILWVKWLHEGSFFVLTVPHEVHIYRAGLELVGIHKLHERHILCLALHNERHEACIACADGTMKRFGITSTLRWEGLGLGYRHSMLQDDFELLKTWHAAAKDSPAGSPIKGRARSRSPARESSPRRNEEIDTFWVASLFTDEERDRLFGCCGLDVHVWRWATGELLTVLFRLHSQPITSCWLSPAPPQPLVTCSRDGTLRVWKYSGDEARLMETLEGHERGVFGMAYDESSGCLFSFGDDGVVMCWNLQRLTYVHSHALYKPAPSFLAMALHSEEGQQKSLFVEARNCGNVASGTIRIVSLPKQRSGNSSFDDDGALKGEMRSGTGLLVIMGTDVDLVEVQTDRLFLTACLAPVKSVIVAHSAAPCPRVPFRESTEIVDGKASEAAIGRIKTGNLGMVLCRDGSVQVFGCSAGEICSVIVPSVRQLPAYTPTSGKLPGRRRARRWKHTRGRAGWELTDITKDEVRRRRLSEETSELGDSQSFDRSRAGARRGSYFGDCEDEEGTRERVEGADKKGDPIGAKHADEDEEAGSDLGPAMACEFHALSGVLLLAWERGTVRLVDVRDGKVVDEIREDKRAMRGGVQLTGACLVPSIEADAPPAPSTRSSINVGRDEHSSGLLGLAALEEKPNAVLWNRWRVARARTDGLLDISEVLSMDGDHAGVDRLDASAEEGHQIISHIKSGECAVSMLQWLNRTQVSKVFKGRLDPSTAEQTRAGALLAGGWDGVFSLWSFRAVPRRYREGFTDAQNQQQEDVEWTLLTRVPTVRDAMGLEGLTSAAPSELHHGCVVCGFGSGSVQVWRMGVVRGDRFSLSVVNAKDDARLRAPHAFDSKKGALVVMDYHMSPIAHCACSPDGLVVITLSEDKGVAEWSVKDGSLLQTIPNEPSIASAAYTTIPRNRGTNVLLRRTSISVGGRTGAGGRTGGGGVVGGDEMVIIVGIGNEVNVLPSLYKEVQGEFAYRWRDRVLSRKGTSNLLLGKGHSSTNLLALHSNAKHAARGANRRASLLQALKDQGSFEEAQSESSKEEDLAFATFSYLDSREAARVAIMHARATTIQCWWRVVRARRMFHQVVAAARERRRAQLMQGEAGREEGERIAEERRLEAETIEILKACSVFALLGFDELRALVPDATLLVVEKGGVLMERERDKEKAHWHFGGGVFLVAEGAVTETVDLCWEGRETTIDVRTVGPGELLGETSMWGGGEACGDQESVTASTQARLLRVPALVLKRRLNAHASSEWQSIVTQLAQAKRSKVEDEQRMAEMRFGGPRRRSSVASLSDASATLSRAPSSAGGAFSRRASSASLRRRGSVVRRGSAVTEAGSDGEARKSKDDRSSVSDGATAPPKLERTGTIELMRFGVSIGLQRLPDLWTPAKVAVWRERSEDGMSKEERDIVTDLQISSMTSKKEGLALTGAVRTSLTAHRREVYLDTVRAKKAIAAKSETGEPPIMHPIGSSESSGDSTARTLLRPMSAMSERQPSRRSASISSALRDAGDSEHSFHLLTRARSDSAQLCTPSNTEGDAEDSAAGSSERKAECQNPEPTATTVASQLAGSAVRTSRVRVPAMSAVESKRVGLRQAASALAAMVDTKSKAMEAHSVDLARPISPVFRSGVSPSALRSVRRNLAANALRLPDSDSSSATSSRAAARADTLLRRRHGGHSRSDASFERGPPDSELAAPAGVVDVKPDGTRTVKVPYGLRASDVGPGYLNMTSQQLAALKPWKHFRSDSAAARPASAAPPRKPQVKPFVPPRCRSHAAKPRAKRAPARRLEVADAAEYSPWGTTAPISRADTVLGIGIQEFTARRSLSVSMLSPAGRPGSAMGKVYSAAAHELGAWEGEEGEGECPSVTETEALLAGRPSPAARTRESQGAEGRRRRSTQSISRGSTWSDAWGERGRERIASVDSAGAAPEDLISFLSRSIPLPK